MKFLSSFSFENIEKLECNNIHFFQYFILLFLLFWHFYMCLKALILFFLFSIVKNHKKKFDQFPFKL